MDIYQIIKRSLRERRRMALCTVVATTGSTPRKSGSKMLVYDNGEIAKTIGGGDLEKTVIENALQVIEEGKPKLFEHKLVHQHGMCCGGTVSIFIEPIMSKKKLYIFGAGHTGKALADFADKTDFEVSLIDERVEIVDGLSFGEEINIIEKNHRSALKDLKFDHHTYVVVVTHNHSYDRDIIATCAKLPHAYLGMIGSQRKVEVAKKAYLAGDILTEEEMENIDWPIGLKINANTPEEIAVSILAKLIKVRNSEI